MKDLSYVVSAMGMLGGLNVKEDEVWFDEYKRITLDLMNVIQNKKRVEFTNTNSTLSILYNAYTEKNHPKEFNKLDNFNADYIYSDSGGLQIITAGKPVNDEIKRKVYEMQTYSDFAMCFDVIPVSSLSVNRTRNERSNLSNRVFNSSQHEDSAYQTGDNVKSQIEYFRKVQAKTKVIIIIQGNSADDMMQYYHGIISKLDDADYEYVGGIALGRACIGFGELESVEVLRAAKRISDICHPNIRKHLHILGVGSIEKMRPILYLIKGGYLQKFERLTYDSSSHTCTFQYGLMKLNGTCISIGATRTKKSEKYFSDVYNFFIGVYKGVSLPDFLDIVFSKEFDKDWKFSSIKNRAMVDDRNIALALTIPLAYTYYQIYNFMWNLDMIYGDKFHEFDKIPDKKDIAINALLNVFDEDRMDSWMKTHGHLVSSKRVYREEEINILENFFD